jgi:kinesin family protein 6/9
MVGKVAGLWIRRWVMNILKRKREILDDAENNAPSSRKRQRRVTGNENINKLCWDWFQDFID